MNKRINEYFANLKLNNNHNVTGIFDNSKQVIEDSVFVAINGYKNNGIDFITEAINNGARTVVVDVNINDSDFDKRTINIIKVLDTKVELARILKWFYKVYLKPVIIGVTGTNGKTSVTNYVFSTLSNIKKNVLLIGTEGNLSYYNGKLSSYGTNNTTPSITVIYQLMYEHNYQYVIMEASSQGISEKRVLGIDFDIICYTNITQDHLDYHLTIREYFHAKESLAISLNEKNTIILNRNMKFFDELKKASIAKCITYGIENNNEDTDITGKIIKRDITEMNVEVMIKGVKPLKIITKLIGDFNLENILATIAILKSIDIDVDSIIKSFENIKPVIGRMNVYKLDDFFIIVDFAHTPDGIYQVLKFFKSLTNHKLITVVGCGGNRDKLKRPLIGKLVTDMSDIAIFTEDNSRNESFFEITRDITNELDKNNYLIIEQRKLAINEAIKIAKTNDIIFLLGKGNEGFIKKDIIVEFSDIKYIETLGGIRLNG